VTGLATSLRLNQSITHINLLNQPSSFGDDVVAPW
jgi:hypothetical protein